MSEESYITEAKTDISWYAEDHINELIEYADKHNLEVAWVLDTYKNKVTNTINRKLKE